VDIEEFYDADPRRRASPEVELGREWRDRFGVRYELNWVADTGELYVMREPRPIDEWEDPFGGLHVPPGSPEGMTVRVIGHMATHERVEEVLAGWESAMAQPDGIGWLVERLRSNGVALTEVPEHLEP